MQKHSLNIKSQQGDLYAHTHGLDEKERSMIARKQHAATSLYQAAECSMCAFQSMFPGVKDTIIHEENNERKVMLKAMIILFNFRTNIVGINQILVFSSQSLSAIPWIGCEIVIVCLK